MDLVALKARKIESARKSCSSLTTAIGFIKVGCAKSLTKKLAQLIDNSELLAYLGAESTLPKSMNLYAEDMAKMGWLK